MTDGMSVGFTHDAGAPHFSGCPLSGVAEIVVTARLLDRASPTGHRSKSALLHNQGTFFFFLFLQRSSSKYFSDAHSRMTASSLGIVVFSSLSSTKPSARVSATLSKASPT